VSGPQPPAILFQDKRFLIIDKPAGMPVHANRAGRRNVEDFFSAWRQGKNGPWLAHRLDQDTAGALVIALKKPALLLAQQLFAGGLVRKTYWALVQGAPTAQAGEIDLPLAKQTSGKTWKMVPADQNFSWLELHPHTGRTHQIRAHCAAIGHPVLGDSVYGGGDGPLCLLSRAILLPLDPPAGAEAPAPAHMRDMLKSCGWSGADG
jgi:tRNA pseudouridine32 synthase/23S rRNA pseudouridine746 synthase